jgi:hypothetical protein
MLYEETDFVIEPGHDSVEVNLETDAQQRLRTMGTPPLFTSRTMTSLLVRLREGSLGSIEVWDRSSGPASIAGPIGMVSAENAQAFHRCLSAATRVGQATICHAIRTSTASGGWRLYLKVPISRDDLG